MSSQLRVVLDTNVLLSGIAYPNSVPGKIVAAWRLGSVDVVLSEFILDELKRVLPRLRHRHAMSNLEIHDFVESLALLADMVEPMSVAHPLLRDANDALILGTLLALGQSPGNHYLITGDKDLLALAQHYSVLTPSEFWARHGGI